MDQPTLSARSSQLDQSGRPVVEPGAFLCDGNVALRINSWNILAGVTITMRMRFLGSDGQEVDNTFDHVPNTNRTKATSDFPLSIGFPLNLIAFASVGAPLIGQTFIQVQLVRGQGAAAFPMATLLQGYVTAVQNLAFPGSPIRTSIESGGVLRVIQGTVPAPGADILETVPTGARWQLISFQSRLVTSAVVATRKPELIFNSPTFQLIELPNYGTVIASSNARLYWVQGLPYDEAFGILPNVCGLPLNTLLLAGAQIVTSTTGLQAGDQWDAPVYAVLEWLEVS